MAHELSRAILSSWNKNERGYFPPLGGRRFTLASRCRLPAPDHPFQAPQPRRWPGPHPPHEAMSAFDTIGVIVVIVLILWLLLLRA